jgi:hypothetical protein
LGGYLAWQAWQAINDAGWVSQERLAIVSAKGWSAGEYKTCTEAMVDATKEEPQLECARFGEERELKRFKVRFYGATYKEELKDRGNLVWRCRKNGDVDPSFTCDDQKVVMWETK